ncbi:MAG: multicopper oxidase domain-containing protein, partial [Friedmanniella sp.]
MNVEDGPDDVTVAGLTTPGTQVPGTTAGEEAEQRPRLLLPSDPEFREIEQEAQASTGMSRRTVLRLGALGVAGAALVSARSLAEPYLASRGQMSADGVLAAAGTAISDLVYIEAFPTSPLILEPFTDKLPIPQALSPVPETVWKNWSQPPGPGKGQQNSLRNETHQRWVTDPEVKSTISEPIVYKIDLKVNTHSLTSSPVLPIDRNGRPAASFDASGKTYPAGTKRSLPASTIYGFNGTFPGPMINAEYGKPVLVRFENHLD